MMTNLQPVGFPPGQPPTPLWSLAAAPISVPPTATLLQVLSRLGDDSTSGHSCVVVVQDEQLVGLLTERDLVRLLASGVALDTPIDRHMTRTLTVLPAEPSLNPLDVLDLMRQRQIHHVPLVDATQRPVRLITAGSIQQALAPPHMLKLQPVRSRMAAQVVTISPTDSALAAAQLLAEYSVSCVAVIDPAGDGTEVLLGQVLRQDVLRFQARQLDLAQLPVRAIMRDAQFCLRPTDSLWLAYQEMRQRRLPCLLVVDSQRQPLGTIAQFDLLNSLDLRELQTTFSHLWQSFKQSDHEQLELWKSHSSELERLVQGRTEQLEEQAKCDRILATLTQRIHESLDMQEILSTTVSEVRQLLQVDRTLIYQFETAARGTVVVEAVQSPWTSLLGHAIEDSYFAKHWAEAYRYGRIQAVEDIQRAGLSPCHVEMLSHLQIKANLVVPIVCDHTLWGLLIINQCSQPRRWCDWEIRLVEQLVRSVAIAIRQCNFYEQMQADLAARKQYEVHLKQLNDELEQRVEARTASWRQVTEQLRESETKFRSLVEQTNDWVWELDGQFKFSYINPRATEIIGYPPEAILESRFTDFMAADEAVRFSTILTHLVRQRHPFTQIEATCLRASGEAVILELSGSPIFTPEGEFQGYRGITRDITERKQIEVDIRKALTREKELSDLKTRFIAMASHEFRTPLTTILASAETLERYSHKFTPEKQQTVLKRIQTSVHHIIGLLNDVLTVGKAEANKLDCTLAPLDLKQLCTDLVDEIQFSQINAASPIEFTAVGSHFQVLADEKLLRHILLNLLSNAVKYSPNHTPVSFKLTCEAEQSIFQISDRGIGIPLADQAQLFGAFHRANNVGNISGTGLGLVIAKRAAEAHQGHISCMSDVGVGTTFTVVLPLALWSDNHG
ncbi:CBS domain-containing protein [Nodosilinea nodulosa]|uniref:CBS domain-containing protein n=1 Tax=Nodosilinea nodulosa TaxID=416001 RepID=UPI0002D45498|nr:CBS domain-containing protein [Nodosilinea nodulosa]